MKLKTNNAAKKPELLKKNKSPKKEGKGVQVRKEKSKEAVNSSILKKEAEKTEVVAVTPSLTKIVQQELWSKAIANISKKSTLSDEESSIVKLLADYKTKSSIPQKKIKFKNFITKGFATYKNINDEILNEVYDKIINEFKAVCSNGSTVMFDSDVKKPEIKIVKKKIKKAEVSDNEEMDVGDEDDDNDDDNDDDDDNEEENDDDDIEGIEFGVGDDDIEEESEEEKPKPKAKGINKNGKSQSNKEKISSKFKGGKVQKNKKFGKKK